MSKSSELDNKHELTKLIQALPSRLKIRDLSVKDAKLIASSIISVANKNECNISGLVLLSIAIKESRLNRDAYNKKTKDFGLVQINQKMIDRLHFNKLRIMKDVKYNVAAGCQILSTNKKQYSKSRPYWLGIYNTGTDFENPEVIRKAINYAAHIKRLTIQIKSQYNKMRLQEK